MRSRPCREEPEEEPPVWLFYRRVVSKIVIGTLRREVHRTSPRSTVIDEGGRRYVVPGVARCFAEAGGPSGAAWPLGPSGCQRYCSGPNVTRVTSPAKDLSCSPSANTTRVLRAALGSLLMRSSAN